MAHDIAGVVVRKLMDRPHYDRNKAWNQAHEAGGSCARQLTYARLQPEDALQPDEGLLLVFEHGRWMEREAVAQLERAGYEVTERDAAFEWREMQLRGRVDGKIRLSQKKRPLEIKGYMSATWAKLNRIEDFLESPKEYLRRVPGQLLSYMLLDGKSDEAVLYLIDKVNGRPKTITLRLEGPTLEWGEAMLKRLELVNKAVADGKLPERIPYEEGVCGSCAFRHICLTEMPAKGVGPEQLPASVMDDLLELLTEREKLDPERKAWTKADDAVKSIVKGHPKILVGPYAVTGQWVPTKRVNPKRMPAKTRARYTDEKEEWRKHIENLETAKQQSEE